jgi:hypothetical protein
MKTNDHSSLDLARANADQAGRILKWAGLPPLPLILLGAALLQFFSPGHAATATEAALAPWYRDVFLLAIFAVYVFGQAVALSQARTLGRGLRKVKTVLQAMGGANASPGASAAFLHDLQARIQAARAPGHLSDLVLQWLRLGLAGDAAPINSLMERGAWRRAKSVEKKIALHATLNRTMLKLGFLGTLIGLIVTFPPMKLAILTLDPKNAEKGASFVQHIAGAIDGDQYAILTTLIATGFSLFIELLTIQILRTLCARFETVNASVDEWCLVELQPAIRRMAESGDMQGQLARQRAFQEQVLQAEKQFQENWLRAQQESEARFLQGQAAASARLGEAWRQEEAGLARVQQESFHRLSAVLQANGKTAEEVQLDLARGMDSLGRMVRTVSEKLHETVPLQQAYGKRLDELLAYERQYRSFLEAQERITVPRHLKPEIN